jgi:hypothetical protein
MDQGLSMAKAGDGGVRSDRRQMDGSVCVRCWARDKQRFKQTSLRLGFPSLSAWIIDLMETQNGASLRLRRVMSGQLGQIGARAAALASYDLPKEVKEEATALAAQIARIQKDLMMGPADASETD